MTTDGKIVPVAERVKTLRGLLDRQASELGRVLTQKYLTPERMCRVAMTAVLRTPLLLDCSPESIVSAVMMAAQCQLDLDPSLGQGYLVPRRNKNTGGWEAQFQAGYRGLIDMARRSGEVGDTYAVNVRKGDKFKVVQGLHRDLQHEPVLGPPMTEEELLATYAVIHYKDGVIGFDVMSAPEVYAIRARSDAYRNNAGPWMTDLGEMAKKTVWRRLLKTSPLRVEDLRDLLDKEDGSDDEVKVTGVSVGAAPALPTVIAKGVLDKAVETMRSQPEPVVPPEVPSQPIDSAALGTPPSDPPKRKRRTAAETVPPPPAGTAPKAPAQQEAQEVSQGGLGDFKT